MVRRYLMCDASSVIQQTQQELAPRKNPVPPLQQQQLTTVLLCRKHSSTSITFPPIATSAVTTPQYRRVGIAGVTTPLQRLCLNRRPRREVSSTTAHKQHKPNLEFDPPRRSSHRCALPALLPPLCLLSLSTLASYGSKSMIVVQGYHATTYATAHEHR